MNREGGGVLYFIYPKVPFCRFSLKPATARDSLLSFLNFIFLLYHILVFLSRETVQNVENLLFLCVSHKSAKIYGLGSGLIADTQRWVNLKFRQKE
jgi:hypothetical protein